MRYLWVVFPILMIVAAGPTGLADPVAFPDRDSTYPAGVANITHGPWSPEAGQDVVVRLTLAPESARPSAVSMLYCRVEPTYACALPVSMREEDGAHWSGRIAWDDRFMDGAEHIGYNLTLRFGAGDDGIKVTAPRGNHWVPPAYPTDVAGAYYFYRVAGGSADAAGVPAGWIVATLTIAALACRFGGARRR